MHGQLFACTWRQANRRTHNESNMWWVVPKNTPKTKRPLTHVFTGVCVWMCVKRDLPAITLALPTYLAKPFTSATKAINRFGGDGWQHSSLYIHITRYVCVNKYIYKHIDIWISTYKLLHIRYCSHLTIFGKMQIFSKIFFYRLLFGCFIYLLNRFF